MPRYVALLRPTVAAIRGVDPGATVISGGLSSARTAPGRITGLDFLTAFAALGGPGLVDAIGFHPYSFPVPPAYPASWNVRYVLVAKDWAGYSAAGLAAVRAANPAAVALENASVVILHTGP